MVDRAGHGWYAALSAHSSSNGLSRWAVAPPGWLIWFLSGSDPPRLRRSFFEGISCSNWASRVAGEFVICESPLPPAPVLPQVECVLRLFVCRCSFERDEGCESGREKEAGVMPLTDGVMSR